MKKIVFALLVIIISLGSCKKKERIPWVDSTLIEPTGDSFELSDNAVVNSDQLDSKILSVDTNLIEFSIGTNLGFNVGDVFVSEIKPNMPNGGIRKIISIDSSGGSIKVYTEYGLLEDAFKNLVIGYDGKAFTTDLNGNQINASRESEDIYIVRPSSPWTLLDRNIYGTLSLVPFVDFEVGGGLKYIINKIHYKSVIVDNDVVSASLEVERKRDLSMDFEISLGAGAGFSVPVHKVVDEVLEKLGYPKLPKKQFLVYGIPCSVGPTISLDIDGSVEQSYNYKYTNSNTTNTSFNWNVNNGFSKNDWSLDEHCYETSVSQPHVNIRVGIRLNIAVTAGDASVGNVNIAKAAQVYLGAGKFIETKVGIINQNCKTEYGSYIEAGVKAGQLLGYVWLFKYPLAKVDINKREWPQICNLFNYNPGNLGPGISSCTPSNVPNKVRVKFYTDMVANSGHGNLFLEIRKHGSNELVSIVPILMPYYSSNGLNLSDSKMNIKKSSTSCASYNPYHTIESYLPVGNYWYRLIDNVDQTKQRVHGVGTLGFQIVQSHITNQDCLALPILIDTWYHSSGMVRHPDQTGPIATLDDYGHFNYD